MDLPAYPEIQSRESERKKLGEDTVERVQSFVDGHELSGRGRAERRIGANNIKSLRSMDCVCANHNQLCQQQQWTVRPACRSPKSPVSKGEGIRGHI